MYKSPLPKKRAPKHPETKGSGRNKKGRYKRTRKKLKAKRLASYTHKTEGEKSKMREHLFTHTALVITRVEPTNTA